MKIQLQLLKFREQTEAELKKEKTLREQQAVLMEDVSNLNLMCCWRAHIIYEGAWLKDSHCYSTVGFLPVFQGHSTDFTNVFMDPVSFALPQWDKPIYELRLEYSLWRINDPEEILRLQTLFSNPVLKQMAKAAGESIDHAKAEKWLEKYVKKENPDLPKDNVPGWVYVDEEMLDVMDKLSYNQYCTVPNFISEVTFDVELKEITPSPSFPERPPIYPTDGMMKLDSPKYETKKNDAYYREGHFEANNGSLHMKFNNKESKNVDRVPLDALKSNFGFLSFYGRYAMEYTFHLLDD